MALFSRRSKDADDQTPAEVSDADTAVANGADAVTPDTGAEATGAEATGAEGADTESADANASADAVDAAEVSAAASVGISMSSFGGFGSTSAPAVPAAQATPTPGPGQHVAKPPAPETAPAQTETIPGLRDNVLVRAALADVSAPAQSAEVLNVVRQMLQGHLFLRVKGDARALIAEGKPLPLAMATLGEKNYALAYSSGAALQESVKADGDTGTSAMGQPVLAVIRHVLAGTYAGLIIDHASGQARVTLPRDLLEKVTEQLDEKMTIKSLLAAPRTDETAPAVAAALGTVPLWVAIGKTADDRPGVAEGRAADGSRYLEVYSHPLEVAAVGRGDRSAPITGEQLAAALNGDEGLSGVVVDPAGPWIRLSREQLAPLLGGSAEAGSDDADAEG
ncbi:SseB family protein [Microbacterium sp. C7(2022)]|uniref:SseB family protein n=1 Tax=Microbacterium sp. C7(2022) TaxID=2992759 RepID=UPI00237AA2DE|nr:SseB family protein [Microbacterium sp. C7(2022)]MDE0547461.1 SseB family protein [Microbacterium sp. C7(2022)]